MLLPHALALVQARSHLATLADRAASVEASSAYERVLIELDRMHGDACPGLDTTGISEASSTVLAIATSAIENLARYAADPLDVELALAQLRDASTLAGS